jgi:hypothetical protein
MSVPDYQSLILLLLKYAEMHKGEVTTNEAVEFLAKE